jgi:hypothetical protein
MLRDEAATAAIHFETSDGVRFVGGTLRTTTRKNRSNPSTATTLDSPTPGHLFRYLTKASVP